MTDTSAAADAITATTTTADLIQVLLDHPVARSSRIVDELRARSAAARNDEQHERAGILEIMSDALEELHATITAFSDVDSEEAFRPVLGRRLHFASFRHFDELARAHADDARQQGNVANAARLDRAVQVYSRIVAAIERSRSLPELDGAAVAAELQEHPEMCHPINFEWLALQAELHAVQDEQAASEYMHWADALSTYCRVAQVEITDHKRKPGFVTLRRWATNTESERWFMNLPPRLGKRLVESASAVSAGTRTVSDVLAESRHHFAVALIAGAQIEFLLRTRHPSNIPELLAEYRRIAEAPRDDPEEQATWVLRYATAVAIWWRTSEDPDSLLRSTLWLVTYHAALADAKRSPRLLRDLRFVEGRILQDLAIWDPLRHTDAATALRAGLAVEPVKYEREPRGRALSDLANSVYHLKGRGTTPVTREAEAHFREALVCLPASEFPLSRSVVLQAYAAFLNERSDGDPAAFQEHALALLNEAVLLLETLTSSETATDLVSGALASAYLTKGNVLVERRLGDLSRAEEAARDSFFAGIRWAQRASHPHIEGLLRLNLATAWLRDFRETGSSASAANAERNFSAADAILAPYPVEHARVIIGFAKTKALAGTTSISELSSAVDEARAATARVDAWPVARDRAYAHHACGVLLRVRGRLANSAADLENSAREFLIAADLDRASGSRNSSAYSSRTAADAFVQLWNLTHTVTDLERAEASLCASADDVHYLWSLDEGLDWRARLSVTFGAVFAELAWVRTTLNRSREQIYEAATLSKNRQLLAEAAGPPRNKASAESATALERIRQDVLEAEYEVWSAARDSATNARSVIDALTRYESERSRLRVRRALFGWQPLLRDASGAYRHVVRFAECNPGHTVIDITVSRYGTVVLTYSAGGVDEVNLLPLTTDVVEEHLIGSAGTRGWLRTYYSYRRSRAEDRSERHAEWLDSTTRLTALLATIPNTVASHHPLDGARVIIAPGQLAGLPLHATAVAPANAPLFEIAQSYAYVPNILALPSEAFVWCHPAEALCILADPANAGEELTRAFPEMSQVARALASSGVAVECLVGIGGESGLHLRGAPELAKVRGVRILDAQPTPNAFRTKLHSVDHVFFTGHGVADGNAAGLILLSESGRPAALSFEDIAGLPLLTRRPIIVLSACETSHEAEPISGEMFSLASAFVRVGAKCVVGHAWAVRDFDAQVFSQSFYEALAQDPDPTLAVTAALRALRHSGDFADDVTRWSTVIPVLGSHSA